MEKNNNTIFIIDDDDEIRQSLTLLLNSYHYKVNSYPKIEQFLKNENYSGAGCILLDVFFKGKTGLELKEEIETKFEHLPIIFISGHGNIPMSVEAVKKGAVSFLQKPIDERELFSALEEALSRSNYLIEKYREIEKYKLLVNSLTAREYEIFNFVITGAPNKIIASELGIAEHTIKNHRLKITEKLGVKSVAELIYIADKLSIKGSVVKQNG